MSWSGDVTTFLSADPEYLVQALSLANARSFRTNEPQQLRAWFVSIETLHSALAARPEAAGWRIILEFPIRRLGRRIDALLITPHGPLVLEFKIGAGVFTTADRRQVEDYALDLQDFHAASRHHPIVPILIATHAAPAEPGWPLFLAGVTTVLEASAASLGGLLQELWRRMPIPSAPLDVEAWEHAPYRPVPGIIDAACTLYSHNGVADIATSRADAVNLSLTTDAILGAVQRARSEGRHIALFVTGIPGAGKTLCGLNTVFGAGREANATFLTGNPTLVHVLREALARDAAQSDRAQLRAARQRTKVSIQALPTFRDDYVREKLELPHERVAVIDEAQRAWSLDHAVRKSIDRKVHLTDSEPGHLLEIMGRHPDWAVVVCLIGNGQEIHDGEGGLAEWGAALARQPKWQTLAAPDTQTAPEPRQRLPPLPDLITVPALHLDIPMRNLRSNAAAPWVDAVLANRLDAARAIAESGPVPFTITRSLAAMRAHLRAAARGNRRCGLVASSGAKRLRADGLGSELAHMEPNAVARWFLDRWPEDVRASDALEQVATEFSCQGLELDLVGLCWGGDLIRAAGAWRVRDFAGTRWTLPKGAETVANRINTYRVLLTRARTETVIWVPKGDSADRTRAPHELDDIASHLLACGATELAESEQVEPPLSPQPSLF